MYEYRINKCLVLNYYLKCEHYVETVRSYVYLHILLLRFIIVNGKAIVIMKDLVIVLQPMGLLSCVCGKAHPCGLLW